jgi:hypothetical protein
MMGEVAAHELYNMLLIAVTVSYLDRRVLGAMHKFVYSLPISLQMVLWLPKIPVYAATFNSLGKQMLRKQHDIICECNVRRRRYIVHEDVDTIMVDADPLSSIGIKRPYLEEVSSASKRRRFDSLSSGDAADFYALDVPASPLLSPSLSFSSPSPPPSPTLYSSSSLPTEKRKREPEHGPDEDDVQPPEKRIKQEKVKEVEQVLGPRRPNGEYAIKRGSSVMENELLARKRRRTDPTTPFATFKELHDVLEVALTSWPYYTSYWNVRPRAHVRVYPYTVRSVGTQQTVHSSSLWKTKTR